MVLVQKELYAAYIGEWYLVPTSITLDKNSIFLSTVGQTEQLTATILPADARQTVTWTSSNTSIATVDSTGLVTCVTPGNATITATTVNGLTATCNVDKATIYSINLANSSTAAIAAAGWSWRGKTPSFNSQGVYLNSASKIWIYKNVDISSAKKIRVTSDRRFVPSADMSLGVQNSSQSNYYYGYKGKLSGGYFSVVYNDSSRGSVSGSYTTGDYSNVFEVDLTTGYTTYTQNGNSVSATLGSGELSYVKNMFYVGAGFESYSSSVGTNGNIVKNIEIAVFN